MGEPELQEAIDRVGASMRRALKAEWRRMARESSIHSPSVAFLDEAPREARTREAAYRDWLGRALPVIADELTETLPPEMRAAGVRFAVDGAGMSGWDAVDDALMYGVGNPPDPWCSDAGCAHADVRHKHTRLFRKPCVIAEDGTILEAER